MVVLCFAPTRWHSMCIIKKCDILYAIVMCSCYTKQGSITVANCPCIGHCIWCQLWFKFPDFRGAWTDRWLWIPDVLCGTADSQHVEAGPPSCCRNKCREGWQLANILQLSGPLPFLEWIFQHQLWLKTWQLPPKKVVLVKEMSLPCSWGH